MMPFMRLERFAATARSITIDFAGTRDTTRTIRLPGYKLSFSEMF
jgi:hypothetical protein